jgi:hypothetical protein
VKARLRKRGLDLRIGQHLRARLLGLMKRAEPVGHRVVLETAFAVLAVVAAVLHGDGDERRAAADSSLGNREVVERVAHELHRAGAIVDDEKRRRGVPSFVTPPGT